MEDLKSVGDDLFNKNMFEEAIDKYTLALDFDSDDKYKIYLNRCLSFYKLKKYNKALSDAIKATRLKPNNAKSWGRLGSCLNILGRKSQAIYAFKKAYELEPLNENYKIEANKEIDLNDSDIEEDETEDKTEDKTEDETEDEIEDKQKDKQEASSHEEQGKGEASSQEKDKKDETDSIIPTLNFMPDVDSLLNNPMFNKMLHNEELIKKMSDQTFQDKILSYQFNPFEVLKDKEIMSFMTSILTKKN